MKQPGSSRGADAYDEKKRIATIGCCCIIFLAVLGSLMTYTIMQAQSEITGIVSLANQQIEVWKEIEQVVDFTSASSSDDFSDQELIAEIQVVLLKNLQISKNIAHNIRSRIDEHWMSGWIINLSGDISEIKKNANVSTRIMESVRRFASHPPELVNMGVATWDTDLQIAFRSGQYIKPLRKLANLAQPFVAKQQKIVLVSILVINSVLIAGVVIIWWSTLLPAFDNLSAQHLGILQTRDHLALEHAKFSAAFQSIRDAVCMIDVSGCFIVKNTPFTEMFLTPEDENGTRSENIYQVINAHHEQRVFDEDKITQSELIERFHGTTTQLRDGKTVHWHFSEADHNIWLLTIVDQTSMIEEQGKALHDERLRTLGQIAGGVAHDFNNILAGVLVRVELLLLKERRDSTRKKHLDSLHNLCTRAAALTSQLLSYSGCQYLTPSEIHVDQLVKLIKNQITVEEHIELSVTSSSSARLNMDLNFFINSVENLVKNASESIENVSGKIEIIIQDTILETDNGPRPYLVVIVDDTGHGFDEEMIDQVCEPFFSTKSTQNGTGLGLSMVQGFVHQSGGKMDVSNTASGGRVSLYFLSSNAGQTNKQQGKLVPCTT